MNENNRGRREYLSLEEHFPLLFKFLQCLLPWEELEEWRGDIDEKINEMAKEKEYPQWKIKILYILEVVPIIYSAIRLGKLEIKLAWIGNLGREDDYDREIKRRLDEQMREEEEVREKYARWNKEDAMNKKIIEIGNKELI